ncbi:four-carbon acid sugar kinase family protein [Solicola gregarius]|uniref:Four-carbon acid sugar kinase family protein n=1 Tax=Solicola gregarius TaxID=2908642 RepID=A0AA46TFA1_9ACTN|nr:four-carbon acid sugar kinase family protein [Solicola gregarius]UYM03503.1 four-carbon acid sugar kinase family protein [Solicola gregarius]
MTDAGPVLVVADDLTGANATAAALARAGMRAVTVADGERPAIVAEFVSRFDAVVISTNARHVPGADAAELVRRAVRSGWPTPLAANRIDSTLRGNVGPTTAALVAEVSAQSGRRAVALCVPAHPEAGRHTVGGVQLLGGRRLEETELAGDPRSPITHSEVATLFEGLRTTTIPLEIVTGPDDRLVAAFAAAVDGGTDVVVADALTTDNIARVARAATTVNDVTWVTVDPGPATVAMAAALGLHRTPDGAPLLAVSGSATSLTRDQLVRLRGEREVVVVRPALPADARVPDVDTTADRLATALESARPDQVVLLASVLDESDVTDVDHATAAAIPRALARAVRRALETHQVDAIFATGGDITASLFAELAAHGLDVEGEIEPLAVAGELVGGPWSGLPIATKGGLVGDTGTTVACIDHLRQAAETRRRRVHPAQSRQTAW